MLEFALSFLGLILMLANPLGLILIGLGILLALLTA